MFIKIYFDECLIQSSTGGYGQGNKELKEMLIYTDGTERIYPGICTFSNMSQPDNSFDISKIADN